MLPPRFEPIKPFLATPAANALFDVPVVILRYLPITDGVNLERRIDTFDIRSKFLLEEVSKFRGYRDPAALPSIGYRVVGYITVYEPLPPRKVKAIVAGLPVYQPD